MTRSTMKRRKSGSSVRTDCVAAGMPVRGRCAIVFLLRSGLLPLPIVEDDGRLSKRQSNYRTLWAQPGRGLVIAQMDRGELSVAEGARLLAVSVRHGRRLLAAYRQRGVAALAHGNRGRVPRNAVAE